MLLNEQSYRELLKRNPDLKSFMHLFRYEIQRCHRPSSEVVMDDEDVMKFLKISKRRLQYIKSGGLITVRKIDPESPRTYYLLSDVLSLLHKNTIEKISSNF